MKTRTINKQKISSKRTRRSSGGVIKEVPLRVDFAGGWLDVPKHARPDGHIVNCAITPKVSLNNWPYKKGGGLGGSAAHSILRLRNGIEAELALGVGWQDPAVIIETGLCVWRSGERPVLEFKSNPDWLIGKMMILWTGGDHNTPRLVDRQRDYELIKKAGHIAKEAVLKKDFLKLCKAILTSYEAQLDEGMSPLPEIGETKAKKYLGGGHGGYALYMFDDPEIRSEAKKKFEGILIEPFIE